LLPQNVGPRSSFDRLGSAPGNEETNEEETKMNLARAFDIERVGEILVVNLRKGMREIEFDDPSPHARDVFNLLRKEQVKNIIVDCHDIDFLRSTALGFFVTVWKRVAGRDGRMVFCNVSSKAREILRATKLDQIWMICGTRAEAMEEVKT
jgi:anti-anti-sigma factor